MTAVAAVLAADVAVAATPAAAAPKAPATKGLVVVSERPDRMSAAVTARAQGSRVEVTGLRTASSTTWVNPDGTTTMELSAGPVRYRQDNAWKTIDLDLAEASDGSVAPKGHAFGLSLGKGGSGKGQPLATVGDGHGRQVVLGAPAALPKPRLEGRTATYPDITPGVDLVMESRRTGFEQHFVLNNRPTGAVSWQLPLATKGLTARAEPDGSISFVDSKDQVVSSLPAATAWDAAVDPRSGDPASTSPVKLTVAQHGKGQAVLTVTPDAAWLADPARQYPVVVDPTYAAKTAVASFDTYVQSGVTTDQSGSTELRAGTFDGTTVARSFINFPASAFRGLSIQSATLNLTERWSYSCTARALNVHNAGAASTATRWTAQPTITTVYGSITTAKGYSSSCPAAPISIGITSLAQAWSSASASTTSVAVALRASETDVYGWKKFDSLETTNNPYISLTYDRAPGTAAAPTVAPVAAYQASGDTAPVGYTNDTTPALTSKASDADGNTVKTTFEVHSSTTTSSSTLKASCTTGLVAQNTNATCSPTTALTNGQYYVRALANDNILNAAAWSPWMTLRVGAGAPAEPSVSCQAPYSNGSWADTAPATSVTCTITTSGTGYTAPAYVVYTLDGAKTTAPVTAPNTANGTSTTTTNVTVPNTTGSHSIVAHTQTPAGAVSADVAYSFGYGSTALTSPAVSPRTTTTSTVQVTAAGPPMGASTLPTATLQWRLAGSGQDETTGWNTSNTALTVTDQGASGVAVTGLWDTRSATQDVPAAITLNDRVPALLDLQVCLTYSGGTQCTWSQQPISVQRVPHAFGNGFPTSAAGPGQVALWTGELNLDATDVTVPGYSGALSLGRSHSTYAGTPDTATGIFGPGWTAQLQGPDDGDAGLQVVDSTRRDGTVALVDSDGSALVFSRPGGRRADSNLAGTYTAANEETRLDGSALTLSGTGTSTVATLTDDDGTVTKYQVTAAPVGTADATFLPVSVAAPGDPLPVKYLPDTTDPARVGRIIAEAPNVTCPATTADPLTPAGNANLYKGCRSLRLDYTPHSTTPPSGSSLGDYPNQLRSVLLEAWDPAAGPVDQNGKPQGAMTSSTVVAYSYDSTGHLRTVTDPRSGLATGYDYAGDKVSNITPAGQQPFQLTYTSESTPRLQAVTRPRPGDDPAGGTATLASYVYDNIPSSGSGLPDLSPTAVAAWQQASAPTKVMAVFGPDHPVSSTDGASLSASDWVYANLSATDALGYTVNTAGYGAGAWQISATDYDSRGNTVRQLDSSATAAAGSLTPGQVNELATVTVYNTGTEAFPNAAAIPAGTLVLDTYGPARDAILNDGSTARVRVHSHTDYDQGAPNSGINPVTGEPYRLATTETSSAYAGAAGAGTEVETIGVNKTGYTDADTGSTTGWGLGTATTSTNTGLTVTSSTGATSTADATTVTRYDSEGRAVETRRPGAAAGTAGTTVTTYYTAGANSTIPSCGNRPEWAGLVCRTAPGGAPSSGPALITVTTAGYNQLLAPTSIVKTSGDASRTTTTSYLTDGRVDTVTSSATGLTGSTPSAGSKTIYDPATGAAVETDELDPTTHAATGNKTQRSYDTWGRLKTYTTVDGTSTEVTSSIYNAAGQLASSADSHGTVTSYTYDQADLTSSSAEHRGLATKVVVRRAGRDYTFTGSYDGDGNLVKQTLPGGIVQDTEFDTVGEPIGRSYTGPVTTVVDNGDGTTSTSTAPGVWLAWAQDNDVTGRVRHEWTPEGAAFTGPASGDANDTGAAVGYDRNYGYDRGGRLTTVVDRTAASTGIDVTDPTTTALQMPCTTRSYGFDLGGNRVRQAVTSEPTTGACTSTGNAAVTTRSYDSADRLTTGGNGSGSYAYDAFGRVTTLPAADAPQPGAGDVTLGYYDSDLIRSITQGSGSSAVTSTYALDAASRRRVTTTTSGGNGTTVTRHYSDDGDNPAWISTVGATSSEISYAEALGGDLAVEINSDGTSTLPLATLHGDIVTTVTLPTSGDATCINGWSDYDEYGNSRDPAARAAVAGAAGYGWLGAKQRATDGAGLTLMGVRVYNPSTGQFTSIDPVPGGNDTAYTYPNDPINSYDLDGRKGCSWRKPWKCGRAIKRVVDHPIFQTVVTAGICAATAGSGCVIANRAFAVYNSINGCVGASVKSCLYGGVTNYGGLKLKSRMFRQYHHYGLGKSRHSPALMRHLPRGGRARAYAKAFTYNASVGGMYSAVTSGFGRMLA